MGNAERIASLISAIEASGVSRSGIARSTGLSPNTVWRLANGEAREPKYETVEKLQKLSEKVGPKR